MTFCIHKLFFLNAMWQKQKTNKQMKSITHGAKKTVENQNQELRKIHFFVISPCFCPCCCQDYQYYCQIFILCVYLNAFMSLFHILLDLLQLTYVWLSVPICIRILVQIQTVVLHVACVWLLQCYYNCCYYNPSSSFQVFDHFCKKRKLLWNKQWGWR